ncbi:uncharacterized protein LOC105837242 [Monomorium pharaonis]|uniref:uncharacterized protein LOC105837242 n=1 Tax=Monomorium pharaonis TaxID=307658 RepID=UPI00063F8F6E|nr:uncharacterized protein LOC105837242 [Monomorium pharaonis]
MEKNEQEMFVFRILLENVIESDEENDSESEEIINLITNLNYSLTRVLRIRCKNYIENVVWKYTDAEFKMHFRLSRLTFRFLLELLTPQLTKTFEGPGRNTIDPEKILLLAIWMMATPNSYRFDVRKATAWRCVMKVVKALYSHLNTFVTWPNRVRAEEI